MLADYLDASFLPGGAKYGDLPGLLSLAAPARLWLAGESADSAALTKQAYIAAGAAQAIEFDGSKADAAPRPQLRRCSNSRNGTLVAVRREQVCSRLIVPLTPLRRDHILDDRVEVKSRLIADRRSQPSQIGHAAADVLEILVVGLRITLEFDGRRRLAERHHPPGQIDNTDGRIAANIEDFADRHRSLHELQDSPHDILNMGEAADLPAVVMNHQRPARQCGVHESRQYHSVGPRLSRADDIEKTPDDDR